MDDGRVRLDLPRSSGGHGLKSELSRPAGRWPGLLEGLETGSL